MRPTFLLSVSLMAVVPATAQEVTHNGRTVDEWVSQLDSSSYRLKREALDALIELGPQAADAIPGVITAIQEEKDYLRDRAVTALVMMGPEAGDAAARAVEEQLKLETRFTTIPFDKRTDVWVAEVIGAVAEKLLAEVDEREPPLTRAKAARALVRLWVHTDVAVSSLLSLVASDDQQVLNAAHRGLSELNPMCEEAIPILIDVLRSAPEEATGDFSHQRLGGAALALGRIGQPAVPAVLELCRSRSGPTRHFAFSALRYMGEPGAAALLGLLSGEGKQVRMGAASALLAMKLRMTEASATLAAFVSDADSQVASQAIAAMNNSSVRLDIAVPALLEAIRCDDPSVQRGAIDCLARIAIRPGGEVVSTSALVEAYRLCRSGAVKHSVTVALAQRGSEARAAVPLILPELDNPTHSANEAAEALGAIGCFPETVVPAILKSRLGGYQKAEAIAPFGVDAVPILIDALQDAVDVFANRKTRANITREENHVLSNSITAALSIERIGPDASAAVPSLQAAAHVLPEPSRYFDALNAVGPAATAAYIDLLKDDRKEIRRNAVKGIARLGTEALDAVPALIEALGDSDPSPEPRFLGSYVTGQRYNPNYGRAPPYSVREGAADALGEIGHGARSALPALTGLLDDPFTDVRKSAARAIAKIRAIGPTDYGD